MRVILIFLVLIVSVGCSSDKKKTPMEMDQVPESVLKVAKDKFPDVKFERAFREPNGDYELVGKDKKGKTKEVELSPSGEITKVE